uniref:Uncharacterized protein n=1 Tax=Glossina palpalis gambiensis TaxID=67801 RepID=A0A1B0BTY2_9MUSC
KKLPIENKYRANSTLRGQPVVKILHRDHILRDQVENITNYQLNENILKYVEICFQKTFFETTMRFMLLCLLSLKSSSSGSFACDCGSDSSNSYSGSSPISLISTLVFWALVEILVVVINFSFSDVEANDRTTVNCSCDRLIIVAPILLSLKRELVPSGFLSSSALDDFPPTCKCTRDFQHQGGRLKSC